MYNIVSFETLAKKLNVPCTNKINIDYIDSLISDEEFNQDHYKRIYENNQTQKKVLSIQLTNLKNSLMHYKEEKKKKIDQISNFDTNELPEEIYIMNSYR